MSQVDREYITRLKGRYTEKYAMQMDDWTAVIVHELNEGVSKLRMENNQSLTNSIRHIDAAAGQIKGQLLQVRFASPRQAFFYGLGNHLLYGLTSLIGICSCIWFYSTQTEFAEKRAFVNQYPSVEKFERIYRDGKTVERDGYEFLVVEPVKEGNIQLARNFLYDKRKDQVLIPIRTQ